MARKFPLIGFFLPLAMLVALLPALMTAPARVAATVLQAQSEAEDW